MFGSFRLGRLFGVTIRCDWSFVLLMVVLIQFFPGDLLSDLLLFGMLFAAVLLHELGHALTARHFGIRVLDIRLFPLGGMARMGELVERAISGRG